MTITTTFYQPVVVAYTGVTSYQFQLETVGPLAFELWYIGADDSRSLASPDRYTVTFSGVSPLYDAGTVKLTKPAPEGTASLSIERNTPITQMLDFKAFSAFPLNMVEFTLDKHMMICQELAYRKCDAVVTTQMTQLISFDAYTPFYASEITFALQNIIDILNQIAGTAQDCSCVPEDT